MKRTGFSDESRRRSAEKARKRAAEKPRKPLKRTAMKKRTAPMGRGRNLRGQPHTIIEQALLDQHRRFQLAAQRQRVCARCGKAGAWHPHHVVRAEWLRNNHRQVDDEDNALRVCPDCHAGHESGGPNQRIHLRQLKQCNLDYAFREMGRAAGYYLRRHYRGEDKRLDELELAHE